MLVVLALDAAAVERRPAPLTAPTVAMATVLGQFAEWTDEPEPAHAKDGRVKIQCVPPVTGEGSGANHVNEKEGGTDAVGRNKRKTKERRALSTTSPSRRCLHAELAWTVCLGLKTASKRMRACVLLWSYAPHAPAERGWGSDNVGIAAACTLGRGVLRARGSPTGVAKDLAQMLARLHIHASTDARLLKRLVRAAEALPKVRCRREGGGRQP